MKQLIAQQQKIRFIMIFKFSLMAKRKFINFLNLYLAENIYRNQLKGEENKRGEARTRE